MPELEVATIPLCIPLFNKAFAISMLIEESDVPSNWNCGLAGLTSGPKILNIVLTPNSLRTLATFFNFGC